MPPAVAAAGITVGGSLLGKLLDRPSQGDRALQDTQTKNLASQTSLADLLGKMGRDQLSLTGPAYKRAQDYYTGILGGGNTAAAWQQMNPERRQISDVYSGATSRVNRQLTGPARDQALGDIAREHAAKLADLVPNARAGAAQALYAGADPARVAQLFGAASGAYGGANAAASNLFQDNQARNAASAENGAAFAKLLGNIDWTSLFGGGKGGTKVVGKTGTAANPAGFFMPTKPISMGFNPFR